MKIAHLIAIGIIFTLTACSTPVLRTTHPPKDINKPKIGTIYYLPKGLIPITISIDEISNKKSDGSSIGSNDASVVNTLNINNTNSQVLAPQPPPKKGDKEEPKKYKVNMTVGDPKYVPDFRFPYFLEYNPSIRTDDAAIIGVGPNQLLQTTTSKSTDQTGAFLGTLAQIAAEALKLAATFGFDGPSRPEEVKPPECQPLHPMNLSTFIDPTPEPNSNFSQDYINSFSLTGTPLTINIKPLYYSKGMPAGYCDKISKEANSPCQPGEQSGDEATIGIVSDFDKRDVGVLFRSLMMYQITISVNPNREMENDKLWCVNPQSKTFSVMAPNDGYVFAVDVSRTLFVEQKTNLTIVNGMLIQIDLNKPSTLLAGAKIPLDIIKAIASIPNDILTLRIKKIQDEGALTKAQGDLLLNEINRLKNENLLQQQRNSSAASP